MVCVTSVTYSVRINSQMTDIVLHPRWEFGSDPCLLICFGYAQGLLSCLLHDEEQVSGIQKVKLLFVFVMHKACY
jgi:hypothetical protein